MTPHVIHHVMEANTACVIVGDPIIYLEDPLGLDRDVSFLHCLPSDGLKDRLTKLNPAPRKAPQTFVGLVAALDEEKVALVEDTCTAGGLGVDGLFYELGWVQRDLHCAFLVLEGEAVSFSSTIVPFP